MRINTRLLICVGSLLIQIHLWATFNQIENLNTVLIPDCEDGIKTANNRGIKNCYATNDTIYYEIDIITEDFKEEDYLKVNRVSYEEVIDDKAYHESLGASIAVGVIVTIGFPVTIFWSKYKLPLSMGQSIEALTFHFVGGGLGFILGGVTYLLSNSNFKKPVKDIVTDEETELLYYGKVNVSETVVIDDSRFRNVLDVALRKNSESTDGGSTYKALFVIRHKQTDLN